MNKHRYIILIALIGIVSFSSSCGEEGEPDLIPDYYYGEVTALKNGVEWTASPFGTLVIMDSTVTLIFDKRTEIGTIVERLGFRILQLESSSSNGGEDKAHIEEVDFITVIDGHATGDRYEFVESSDSYVTITSYDREKKMAEGIFQATFVLIDDSEWTENTPDTVRFTNGVFNTMILPDDFFLSPGELAQQ